MDRLYDRLIGQLDTLIPFLALVHREAFDLIGERYGDWLPEWQQGSLPETYAIYQTQVAHSAFLLGYSYYEAFLSDLARQIYTHSPTMLPQEKTLTFSDVIQRPEREQLLAYMIDKEILSVFYQSIEKVIECFQKKFSLCWPEHTVESAVEASLLRNCIIHNNARVDTRLSERGRWALGSEIKLTAAQVHDFGIIARKVCGELAMQADSNFLSR